MEEKGVATLDRALAILDSFTEESPRLSLADISRRTGLYKSTLLRLLSSLQQSGLIGHDADGGYHVGGTAMRLANLYQRSLRGAHVIAEALQRLVDATSENANFYVRRDNVRVCIYCAESPHRVRAHTLVGDIFPLDRGAGGKILSAFSDDLCSGPGLAKVRERCIAISHGEHANDLSGIAAPVFGLGRRIEGAVSVTGPTSRFTPEQVASFELELLQAAAEMTSAFGGHNEVLKVALAQARQEFAAKALKSAGSRKR
jgi:DNA-binding IclR family transcriptional regulator